MRRQAGRRETGAGARGRPLAAASAAGCSRFHPPRLRGGRRRRGRGVGGSQHLRREESGGTALCFPPPSAMAARGTRRATSALSGYRPTLAAYRAPAASSGAGSFASDKSKTRFEPGEFFRRYTVKNKVKLKRLKLSGLVPNSCLKNL